MYFFLIFYNFVFSLKNINGSIYLFNVVWVAYKSKKKKYFNSMHLARTFPLGGPILFYIHFTNKNLCVLWRLNLVSDFQK